MNILLLVTITTIFIITITALVLFLVLQFTGHRRPRTPWIRVAFWINLALFVIGSPALVILNIALTQDTVWFPYVILVWGITLLVHAALSWTSKAAPEEIFP